MICREIYHFCKAKNIPLFGVCLGHQLIGYEQSLEIVKADVPMHGIISDVYHDENDIFENIKSPMSVVRYHSLIVSDGEHNLLKSKIKVTARSETHEVMGLKLNEKPIFGVQFHPESICTERGEALVRNFLRHASKHFQSNMATASRFILPFPEFPNLETKFNAKKNLFVKSISLNVSPVSLYNSMTRFYANDPASFWLDSENYGNKNNFKNSRFSYMGNCSGPLAMAFSCTKENKNYVVRSFTKQKDHWASKIITANYFDLMNDIMKDHSNFALYDFDSGDRVDREKLDFFFFGGLVGYFGYRMRQFCAVNDNSKMSFNEGKNLKQCNSEDKFVPDAFHVFTDRVLVLDHKTGTLTLVMLVDLGKEDLLSSWHSEIETILKDAATVVASNIELTPTVENIVLQSEVSDEEYCRQIRRCKELIVEGETYEVCLTKRVFSDSLAAKSTDPMKLYHKLRKVNPAPYACYFFVNFSNILLNSSACKHQFSICSSSPERFVKVKYSAAENTYILESKPIKGTIKRSKDPKQDQILKSQLAASVKDKSENLMIVDLVRNDFGRVCDLVDVPKLFHIESFENVHQMVSTVTGKVVNYNETAVELIRTCFPGGSMVGAPKTRTLDIIESLENSERGIYSGCIGYFSFSGDADSSIVIRTFIKTENGLTAGTGGAIVHLSEVEDELDETKLKVNSIRKALVS